MSKDRVWDIVAIPDRRVECLVQLKADSQPKNFHCPVFASLADIAPVKVPLSVAPEGARDYRQTARSLGQGLHRKGTE
jgi:hypothetical protein